MARPIPTDLTGQSRPDLTLHLYVSEKHVESAEPVLLSGYL